jgi:hypothetical protein
LISRRSARAVFGGLRKAGGLEDRVSAWPHLALMLLTAGPPGGSPTLVTRPEILYEE